MGRCHAARHGGLAIASPIDIVFSQYDVMQPDVVFFGAARRHLVDLPNSLTCTATRGRQETSWHSRIVAAHPDLHPTAQGTARLSGSRA
jgi:hypothetical protein